MGITVNLEHEWCRNQEYAVVIEHFVNVAGGPIRVTEMLEDLLCDYDVEALRKEILGDIKLGKIHSPVVCDTARIDDRPTAGRNLKYLERIERQRS